MIARVVSDPEAVREVLRRVDEFAPDNALVSVVPLAPATLRRLAKVRFALPPVLASASGDEHRHVRAAVTKFFTPAKVAALRPMLEEIAARTCADAAARLHDDPAPLDLVTAISEIVPPRALAELLRLELPDRDTLHRWSRSSLELFWGWPDEARQLELADDAAELYQWLRTAVRAAAARLADRAIGDSADGADGAVQDGPDFFEALLAAGVSEVKVCSLAYFLIIAGQETTTQLIGICLQRGLESPDPGALADPDAARDHVRRVLATESSVPTWRRIAATETHLRGDRIPAGAEIVLELSGHHGPDAAPTAYALAFGYGAHRCLGAGLAELQATIVTAAAFAALPATTRLAGVPPWRRLLSFQSPIALEVVAE